MRWCGVSDSTRSLPTRVELNRCVIGGERRIDGKERRASFEFLVTLFLSYPPFLVDPNQSTHMYTTSPKRDRESKQLNICPYVWRG